MSIIQPIHHWYLNDYDDPNMTNPNIYDKGSNPVTGTAYNCVMSQTGKIDTCVQFTGTSSYIDYGTISSSLLAGTGRTKMSGFAWVYPNAGLTSACIFSKYDGTGDNRAFIMQVVNNSIIVGVSFNGEGVGGTEELSSSAITADAWQHVGFTYNAGDIKIYHNGAVNTSTVWGTATSIYDSAAKFIVGAFGGVGATSNFFNGNIEDVRIYDKALTPWEIRQIYKNGAGTYNEVIKEEFNDTGLLHHWRLNDATTTIADYGASPIAGSATACILSQTGIIDKCIQFTGTASYIYCGKENITLTGISVSYWLNPISKTGDYVGLVNLNSDNANARFQTVFHDSKLQIYTKSAWNDTGKDITITAWSYVTWTKDNSLLKLYINGDDTGWSIAHSTGVGGFVTQTVGRHVGYYNGLIEDVRIYNRALTQREVQEIYNYGAGTYKQKFDDGPIHQWRLNDGINEIHDWGLVPVAGSAASVILSQTGHIERSVEFTGTSSYINCKRDGIVDRLGESDFTVTLWQKYSALPAASTSTWFSTYAAAGGGVIFRRAGGAVKGNTIGGASAISSSFMTTGTWYNLAMKYTKGTGVIALYADGSELTTTNSNSTTFLTANASLYIGRLYPGQDMFSGNLEDIRIYDKALSDEEIAKIYNRSKGTYQTSVSDKRLPSMILKEPIHQWRLNDSDNSITDYGRLPVTGSAASCILSQTGVIDRSIGFTGTTSYINCGNPSDLRFIAEDKFSFVLWVNPSATQSTSMISKRLNSGAYTGYQFNLSNSHLECELVSVAGDGDLIQNIGETPLVTGTWYNVGLTYDGSGDAAGFSMYINGVGEVLSTVTNALVGGISTTVNFNIGSRGDGANALLNGYLEDVRIYDYALSQGAITNIYNEGAGTYGKNPEARQAIDQGTLYDHTADSWNIVADIQPTHHWKLNEYGGTTVVNDSGTNPVPGSITSCVLSQTGNIDRCMYFTQTFSQIAFPELSTSSLYSADRTKFSVCGWVKPAVSNQLYATAISKYSYGDNLREFAFGLQSLSTYFVVSQTGTTYVEVTGTSELSITVWSHIGATFDSGHIRVYRNGILESSHDGTTATSIFNGGPQLVIGAMYNEATFAYAFNGYLEDIRTYQRALTEAEMAAIYNGGRGTYDHSYRNGYPTAKDPIHHWKLQEQTLNAAFQVSDSGSEAMVPGTAVSCVVNQAGVVGKSFLFTGTASYINVGSAPSLAFTGSSTYTYNGWIKTDAKVGAQGIFTKCTDLGDQHHQVYVLSGTIYFTAGGDSADQASLTSGNVADDYWHMFSASKNVQDYKLYIDSVLITQQTVDIGVCHAISVTAYIGCSSASANFFDGNMEDVRVYDYPLSVQEIQNLYNQGKGTLL